MSRKNKTLDYVVLQDGRKFDLNNVTTKTRGYFTTTQWVSISLFTVKMCTEEIYDDGITRYRAGFLETVLGHIDYAYTNEDLEDAKKLIFMEQYFPNLKPVKITKTIKRLMKELKGEE